MPDYGINWDRVDARKDARLAALAPAEKVAEPDSKPRSTRKRATKVTEPKAVTEAVSAKVIGEKAEAEDPDEGIDMEPEDADGEKV